MEYQTGPSYSTPRHAVRTFHAGETACRDALLAAGLVANVPFVNSLKGSMDTNRALVVLLERALREQKISPTDLSIAPFGFAGWHPYPYFVAHDGVNDASIGGFYRYLDGGALTYETRSWDDPRPIEQPQTIVATDVFPAGWGRTESVHDSPSANNLPGVPPPRPWRLSLRTVSVTDAEWRQLLVKPNAVEAAP